MAQETAGPRGKRRLKAAPIDASRLAKGSTQTRKIGSRVAKRTSKVWRPLRPVGRVIRTIGRFIVPRYFRNSFRELRQVTWPNRRESWRLTSAVLFFSVIFGVIVAAVDFGLDKLFKEVLLK